MGQAHATLSKECFSFIKPVSLPKGPEVPPHETILVIGGGIAGLVAAYCLDRRGTHVILVEKSDRYGGQIDTIEFPGVNVDSPLIIEQGAEGFVARSTAIPKIAAELGIAKDLINQGTYDNMTLENGELRVLPTGESARKLGFQVDKKHFGAGLRTFRRGLGQLVTELIAYLERSSRTKLHRNCNVEDAVRNPGSDHLLVTFCRQSPHFRPPILCHKIIAACSTQGICRIFGKALGSTVDDMLEKFRAFSNVNVNLVYHKTDETLQKLPNATGFSIPLEDQKKRFGLRAISFASQKFPEQIIGPFIVLRAHFRPLNQSAEDSDKNVKYVTEAKNAITEAIPSFNEEPTQSWVYRWPEALVERSPEFLEAVTSAEKILEQVFGGRVQLAGSSIGHVGVDGAVISGIEATERLLDVTGKK